MNTITDTSIIEISKNCNNLHTLNISGCDNITDTAIIEISKNCVHLHTLDVSKCSKITILH